MKKASNLIKIAIPSLLALLGFSCFINGGYAEYGVPSATYKAKGIVVSEEDNTPIEGIHARLFMENSYRNYTLDSTLTDSYGSFSLIGHEFPGQMLYVELLHLDGELTGTFTKKILEADFTNATFTGGSGNWYEGQATIDLGTITF